GTGAGTPVGGLGPAVARRGDPGCLAGVPAACDRGARGALRPVLRAGTRGQRPAGPARPAHARPRPRRPPDPLARRPTRPDAAPVPAREIAAGRPGARHDAASP